MAKKAFVPVVFVPVAFVQARPVIEPVTALNPPLTATDEALIVARFEVPLTLIFDEVTPPKNVTPTVVVAPRAVTDASVSASATAAGQFVPFERQTLKPPTKTCVDDTRLEKRFVVVTLVMVAFVPRMAEILPEFAIKEPIVPFVV